MAIYALGELVPEISSLAYIHPDAVIIGNVTIGDETTVWPSAVVRGDYGEIRIGARTSIQDGTVVHCIEELPTLIGSECVVGHNAYLEGCSVEDRCLIGSSALILNGVIVRHDSVIAAGAVVRENMIVPPKTMVAGIPATERGPVSDEIAERIQLSVGHYVANAKRYATDLRRLD